MHILQTDRLLIEIITKYIMIAKEVPRSCQIDLTLQIVHWGGGDLKISPATDFDLRNFGRFLKSPATDFDVLPGSGIFLKYLASDLTSYRLP